MEFCIHCMEPLEAGAAFCPKCGKAQSDACPPHHLQPGTLLSGRYLLGTALGSGGFGITYIAHDTRLEMTVAVKEFFPAGYVQRSASSSSDVLPLPQKRGDFKKSRHRFLAEAKLLRGLRAAPGFAAPLDAFEENNTAYVILRYLRGDTLKAYLKKRGGRLPFDEATALLRPVMDALSCMHRKGILHLDVSPQNILITDEGAVLMNTDLAARIKDARPVMVSRGDSPPEIYLKKDLGPWTDVYSFCATLFHCVTGHPPTDALERLGNPDAGVSFDGTDVSPAAQAALTKGLALQPKDRCRSIEEFCKMLDRW
ncbi:MAG: protein kinase [Clostridia bacterium]|nr:protein kinase [Clostridia bacterium]